MSVLGEQRPFEIDKLLIKLEEGVEKMTLIARETWKRKLKKVQSSVWLSWQSGNGKSRLSSLDQGGLDLLQCQVCYFGTFW